MILLCMFFYLLTLTIKIVPEKISCWVRYADLKKKSIAHFELSNAVLAYCVYFFTTDQYFCEVAVLIYLHRRHLTTQKPVYLLSQ